MKQEYGSVFVLSGENLSFQEAEIRALIHTYSPKSSCVTLGQRVIASDLSEPDQVYRISERAAYSRYGGLFVSSSPTSLDLLTADMTFDLEKARKTFAVTSETLDREKCGELGAKIKEKTGGKVSLDNPDYLFDVESVEGGFVLVVSTKGRKMFTWRERRPRSRKFFLPSAIYPKLARLLVNLSQIREHEIFLDPFCGTGSLLIEASMIGARPVGVDLTRWIARGALLNLKGLQLAYESIIRADSTHRYLPFARIDGISTDVPYGRAASTRGKETGKIIRDFLLSASEALDKSRCCVVMHPSSVEVDFDRKSFQFEEEHLLYVHRNLTRAITVLRRI